jgi:hypothetical protein
MSSQKKTAKKYTKAEREAADKLSEAMTQAKQVYKALKPEDKEDSRSPAFCTCRYSRVWGTTITPDVAHKYQAIGFCQTCKLYISGGESSSQPVENKQQVFIVPQWSDKLNKFVPPQSAPKEDKSRCGECTGCLLAQGSLNISSHVFAPLPACWKWQN